MVFGEIAQGVGILLSIIALILTFAGYWAYLTYLRIVGFIIGAIVGSVLSIIMGIPSGGILIMAIVIGIIFAWITVALQHFLFIATGFLAGFIVGLVLLSNYDVVVGPGALIFGIAGGILGQYYHVISVIVSTSLIGSVVLSYSAPLALGQASGVTGIPGPIILILFLLGISVQWSAVKDKDHEELSKEMSGHIRGSTLLQVCPNCGEEIQDVWNYCSECRTYLGTNCPNCGLQIEAKWNICNNCGENLHAKKETDGSNT